MYAKGIQQKIICVAIFHLHPPFLEPNGDLGNRKSLGGGQGPGGLQNWVKGG